jgi:hypothetical protein
MTIISRDILEMAQKWSATPAERKLIESHLGAHDEIRRLRGALSDVLAALDSIDAGDHEHAVARIEAIERKTRERNK